MSKRADIPNRLIYTCRCGWVDKGHLDSREYHADLGAQGLWRQMKGELGEIEQHGFKGFPVLFSEEEGMSFRIIGWQTPAIKDGVHNVYIVKKGLSISEKESVALGIFLDVSYEFEAWQSGWLHSHVTDSGFSEEDLVSDLIGFYLAVRPNLDWEALCLPVSTAASLAIWDKNGSVGSHKNRTLTPNLYPCAECTNKKSSFPSEFSEIRRAAPGDLYREFDLVQNAYENPGPGGGF
jgi:hypothetical protein